MDKILIGLMASYYFGIIGLMTYMFKKRKAAIKSGAIKFGYFKTYQGQSPDDLKVIENHVNNQFQIPLVFFVACLLNLQQNSVSIITVALALIFVASRILHSYIHLGQNNVLKRAGTFSIGLVSVGLMLLNPLFTT